MDELRERAPHRASRRRWAPLASCTPIAVELHLNRAITSPSRAALRTLSTSRQLNATELHLNSVSVAPTPVIAKGSGWQDPSFGRPRAAVRDLDLDPVDPPGGGRHATPIWTRRRVVPDPPTLVFGAERIVMAMFAPRVNRDRAAVESRYPRDAAVSADAPLSISWLVLAGPLDEHADATTQPVTGTHADPHRRAVVVDQHAVVAELGAAPAG